MPIKAFLLVIVKIGGTNKKQKNNKKIWYTELLELLAIIIFNLDASKQTLSLDLCPSQQSCKEWQQLGGKLESSR